MTPGAQAPFSPAAREPESDPGALAQHVAGLTAALEQIGVRSIAHPALADSPLLAAGLDYLLRRAAHADAPPHPLPARVCWSRIRYRQHFRPAAARRELRSINGRRRYELTVDLGRVTSPKRLETELQRALGGHWYAPGVAIGSFVTAGTNPAWQFNAAYWRRLPRFMQALGRDFRDSIGGSPDTNDALTEDAARRFIARLRAARAAATADGAPLAYLDVGAAGCEHAAAMLGYLAAARAGPVEYLLADVSPAALKRARERLGDRRGQVTIRYLQLDLQQYRYAGLMPYRGRILTIHLTNMLDNLAGERLAQVNGRHYLLHVQLYLPGAALRSLAAAYRLRLGQAAAALAAIPTTGVERFLDEMGTLLGGGEDRLMRFWYDLYGNPALPGSGLKLLERLVEIPNLTGSEALPHELFGIGRLPRAHAVLGELLEAAGSDVWLPLSERAVIGCLRLFALLHPAGALEITDILLREPVTHYAAYAGPAKYDGSVVEWVNGGLLQACARRVFPGCSFHAESLAAAGKPHVTRLVLRPRGGAR